MEVKRQNWFEVKGDETLALDWPLDKNSHVWEIGGFEGRWAAQIAEKFDCWITIFEPQLWAAKQLQTRFSDNLRVTIRPYGLWYVDDILPLVGFFTDGASLLKPVNEKPTQLCQFKNIYPELYNFNIFDIDLCLMNIEGAEYFVIPTILSAESFDRFEYFWCQFHPDLIDEPEKRFESICKRIAKTHEMLWDCYPTAVAWKRK